MRQRHKMVKHTQHFVVDHFVRLVPKGLKKGKFNAFGFSKFQLFNFSEENVSNPKIFLHI